jgi:hypothetical protein
MNRLWSPQSYVASLTVFVFAFFVGSLGAMALTGYWHQQAEFNHLSDSSWAVNEPYSGPTTKEPPEVEYLYTFENSQDPNSLRACLRFTNNNFEPVFVPVDESTDLIANYAIVGKGFLAHAYTSYSTMREIGPLQSTDLYVPVNFDSPVSLRPFRLSFTYYKGKSDSPLRAELEVRRQIYNR